MSNRVEVAIIGAGMAGITCAIELQRLGKQVVILEKSRGVGGRMATRRLFETRADHGTCYLTPKDPRFQAVLDRAIAAGVVKSWTDTVHIMNGDGNLQVSPAIYPRYIAPLGMNSIAKFMALDLDIRCEQRVVKLAPVGNAWRIEIEGATPTELIADTLILTVPAPQSADLLAPCTQIDPMLTTIMTQIRSVEFVPNITVMASYTPEQLNDWYAKYPDVYAVSCAEDADLGWLGVDSSKRDQSAPPVFVLQSTAQLAADHAEHPDLKQIAAIKLLDRSAELFSLPWLAHPQWQQTQLWRYAFAKHPLTVPYLRTEQPAPLILTGDWCGGRKVENAFLAGLAVAESF
jgi:renalase